MSKSFCGEVGADCKRIAKASTLGGSICNAYAPSLIFELLL
jgi:hypothetical protein